MKKIYNSPVIDTIELARPIMDGPNPVSGKEPSSFAPKPRPGKPF